MATKMMRFLVAVLVVLLIALAGVFLYKNFTKQNKYFIKNKYYGFELKTPKNWIAKERVLYSEDNISEILTECRRDKSDSASVYEIGAFRFEDKKYPENFGESGYLPSGLPSGAILEITVNCVPDGIKSKIENTAEGFFNSPEFGQTKQLSFLHNNFQYKISELVYISPGDKEKSKENYTDVFNKIISSFKFTK